MTEQAEVTALFAEMLAECSKDGGKKRAAGQKVDWRIDTEHEAGMFSHLSKWKHGELEDADSGAHPLVHLAWRALAIAYQEVNEIKDFSNSLTLSGSSRANFVQPDVVESIRKAHE